MDKIKTDRILIIKPLYDAWPVGYAYVLACFEANGIPFDFIDSSRSKNWVQEVVIKLKHNDYLAVAMGGLIGFHETFKTAVNLVRKYSPGTPFILGGNIIKDASDRLLFEIIGIDFGIIGEAETSIPQFMHTLKSSYPDFSEVPGLVYRNTHGEIIRNPPKRLDLRQIDVRPAWHNFDVNYYIVNSSSPFIGNNLRFMPMLSGRGCIGKCRFCSPSIGGFRKRLIEDVISEIEWLISKYNFDGIMFFNEMFYPTAREINEFCQRYKTLKNRKPWVTAVRIDANIDTETFVAMRDAGCMTVGAGIESGSNRVLERMNKKITVDQIRSFCQNARIAEMPVSGTFIAGYEGETEEDLKKTIDLLINEKIISDVSLLYVYPGTAVYKIALQKGFITDEMVHLQKAMKYGTGGLFNPIGTEDYFNISAIPNDGFFKIVTREVRRYLTFVFTEYPVRYLSSQIKIHKNNGFICMAGRCHKCHGEVSYEYKIFNGLRYTGFLGDGVHDRLICPKCYSQLSFDIYKCDNAWELPNYLVSLKNQIAEKNRIVIVGINRDLNFLLRINLLNMDYEKILGIVAMDENYIDSSYLNYPVISVDNVLDLKPDCILWLNIFSDTRSILRKFIRNNISPPAVIYLCSTQLQDSLKNVRREIMTKGGLRLILILLAQYLKRYYSNLVKILKKHNIDTPRFIEKFVIYCQYKFDKFR